MAFFKSLLAFTVALVATVNAAPKLEARQATAAVFLPMGCWSDQPSARTLKQTTFTDATGMTVEKCTAFCQNGSTPFKLAGLENGQECWCSNAMDNGPTLISSTKCNLACPGGVLGSILGVETCGGPNALDVWRLDDTANVSA